MGQGIAQIAAQSGSTVWLFDVSPGAADKAQNALFDQWDKLASKGKLSADTVSLYRARIRIPSQVPVGTYETETYLIDRGKVIAAATKEVEVRKAGFERLVATTARRHGFFYGLAAVEIGRAHV